MKNATSSPSDLSAQIADALRQEIISGVLLSNDRLPSEADLCEKFDVSRSTVREALKRLAAQNLIRTQRGHTGGAFVNKLTFDAAVTQHIGTSTLLLSMNAVSFETACEARFTLERACATLACARRERDTFVVMKAEVDRQSDPALSDEAFCASDVAFHRAFVDAADNPVLSYQLAGAVEAMQPLMNMITFPARDRARIVALHIGMANALKARDPDKVISLLHELETYTLELADTYRARRAGK
jgi:GntR family transcriptional regulator, transcriptional repressor for pyruvate dehydrogenase complex